MVDERQTKLAINLVNYSCMLKEGEKVLIEVFDIETSFTKELIKAVYEVGAVPFVEIRNKDVDRALMMSLSKEQLRMMAKYDALRMSEMDAYIGVRGSYNTDELSDVPQDKLDLYEMYYQEEVHGKIRVPKTRWVVLRYPTSSMAQSANMSTEAFEDFYFKVCNLDYGKMSKAMDSLVKYLEKTDKVRIVGKDTDITFSIKGLPAVKCAGDANIPDGEVFTAPVKDSVNGVITYNTPSLKDGFTFENIRLEFKNGKIVKATANNTEKINKIFDRDEGARYVGEFSFGINPYILKPMKDTLFDEKISGSIHFTPGASYDDCDNGNKSCLHWDLVYIQRPEYGGGEIYLDDVLVRKDGLFVVEELKCLNPEFLK